MKAQLINLSVILSVLAVTGAIRMPYEQKFTEELRDQELIPKPLDMKSRLALKQKGFSSGFGSLRPTLAAFLDLAASNDHSDQDWPSLETKYNDIILLDPTNSYYWKTGSWHLISNAAGDIRDNTQLPYLTRNKLFHQYIDKGEKMIQQGMKVNPNNATIHSFSPRHYADKHRRPNYLKAAAEYDRVSKMSDVVPLEKLTMQRFRLYALNKVPDKHQEAYDLAVKLFEQTPQNHLPSLLTSVLVGQSNPLNKVSRRYTLNELFGSPNQAYHQLKIQWKYKNPLESKYGIAEAIKELEDTLFIPQKDRIFPLLPSKPLFLR